MMNTLTSRIVVLATCALVGCASSVREIRTGVYEAKCKTTQADCVASAEDKCGQNYQQVNSDAHSGGLLSDAMAGPVTWHTLTFTCGSAPSDSVAPQAAQLRASALDHLRENYIATSCDQRQIGELEVTHCGLTVNTKVWSEEALVRFFNKVCDLTETDLAEPVPDSCVDRLWRKWYASLAERYHMMDAARVQTRCDANPEDCMEYEVFESWCLESHNRAVLDRYQQEKGASEEVARAEQDAARRDLAAERQAEEAERRALSDSLSRFGAQLQGKPVFRCSADGRTCWQE